MATYMNSYDAEKAKYVPCITSSTLKEIKECYNESLDCDLNTDEPNRKEIKKPYEVF